MWNVLCVSINGILHIMESSSGPLYFHYYSPISNIPFDLGRQKNYCILLCLVAGCEWFVCASVFIAPTSPSILPDLLALIFNWRFVVLCKSIDLRSPTLLAFVSLLINFCLARDFSCVRFQWQVELNVLAWLGPPGPWVFAYQC